MNDGITAEEACAYNTIGTQEDFERLCNSDGTIKDQPKTTTISAPNNNFSSVTVLNSHLYIAIGTLMIIAVIALILVIKRLNTKKITDT